MKLLAVAGLALALFVSPASASSQSEGLSASQTYDSPALSVVPSFYTGHFVNVHCSTEAEMQGAWGYTYPIFDTEELWLDDSLCAALESPGAEDWRKALAVLVLTHESWHLVAWLHVRDEARVECAAIRRWHQSAGLLGIGPDEQASLWPWALVEHFYIGYKYKPYRHIKCKVPGWPPWD